MKDFEEQVSDSTVQVRRAASKYQSRLARARQPLPPANGQYCNRERERERVHGRARERAERESPW